MTNAEKRGQEILKQECRTGNWALNKYTNEICDCTIERCRSCIFFDGDWACTNVKAEWLNSEYKQRRNFGGREMKFICKKCGSTDYKIIEKSNGNGIATGLYCAKCGQWQKWLNKQEKALFADDINDNRVIDKDNEIARLKAENAELKLRLEKAKEK